MGVLKERFSRIRSALMCLDSEEAQKGRDESRRKRTHDSEGRWNTKPEHGTRGEKGSKKIQTFSMLGVRIEQKTIVKKGDHDRR